MDNVNLIVVYQIVKNVILYLLILVICVEVGIGSMHREMYVLLSVLRRHGLVVEVVSEIYSSRVPPPLRRHQRHRLQGVWVQLVV